MTVNYIRMGTCDHCDRDVPTLRLQAGLRFIDLCAACIANLVPIAQTWDCRARTGGPPPYAPKADE